MARLQARRYGASAKRFLKRLIRSRGSEPRKIATDKLRSHDQVAGSCDCTTLICQYLGDSITELVSTCRVGTTTVFSSILNVTLYKKRDNRCSD